MDSNLCASQPTDPRVPVAPGTGNFNATVTLTAASPATVCGATKSMVTSSPAYTGGSFLSRGVANMLVIGACFAIDEVTLAPNPRNAGLIAMYDGYVAALVRGGWLTPTGGATLTASAAGL
jgi:hypothetical protein